MNNRERIKEAESYHLFIALRRKKENREGVEQCHRQIIRDEEMDLNSLKGRIKSIKGIWRIYKTVNKRKVEPARKLMMKYLIDEPEKFGYKVDILWKNCLLQKSCKGERNFMIDIDTKIIPEELGDIINSGKIEVDELIPTPNGWHIICRNLDTRLLQGIKDIEVKRDDIKFVELIKND